MTSLGQDFPSFLSSPSWSQSCFSVDFILFWIYPKGPNRAFGFVMRLPWFPQTSFSWCSPTLSTYGWSAMSWRWKLSKNLSSLSSATSLSVSCHVGLFLIIPAYRCVGWFSSENSGAISNDGIKPGSSLKYSRLFTPNLLLWIRFWIFSYLCKFRNQWSGMVGLWR